MLHEEVEVIERAMFQELGAPACAKPKRVDGVARDQVGPLPPLPARARVALRPRPPPAPPAPGDRAGAQVVSTLLSAHQQRCEQLHALHEDRDGARRDEVDAMSGAGVFSSFYDQMKAIREYHRKHQIPVQTESYERALLTEVLADASTEQSFTGEEATGAQRKERAGRRRAQGTSRSPAGGAEGAGDEQKAQLPDELGGQL